jgi:hypothetical protein
VPQTSRTEVCATLLPAALIAHIPQNGMYAPPGEKCPRHTKRVVATRLYSRDGDVRLRSCGKVARRRNGCSEVALVDLGRPKVGLIGMENNKVVIWSDPPPRPRTDFEAGVIRELETLVRGLPPGTASLRIGRLRASPGLLEPEFDITPANPKAAPVGGYAMADDLELVIGHAEQEFFRFARGGNIVRGASWQEELRWIWEAVVAGGFAQRHYFNKYGKLIGGYSKILVKGTELVFSATRPQRLFGRAYASVNDVIYEPYVQP